MSIRDVIKRNEGTSLWCFDPPSRVPLKRRLFLTATARRHLLDPGSAINVLGARGHVQNAMVRWVSGGLIHADERGNSRFLKRLCPPPQETWEVRVTDPVPQFRLLGRIIEPDTLILARFHTRQHLGDKGNPNSGWKTELPACDAEISAIFAGEPLMLKEKIQEYVTENCREFEICKP